MVGKISKVPCLFGGLESCGSLEFQPDVFSSLLGMSFLVFLTLFCCFVDEKLKGNTRKLLFFFCGDLCGGFWLIWIFGSGCGLLLGGCGWLFLVGNGYGLCH